MKSRLLFSFSLFAFGLLPAMAAGQGVGFYSTRSRVLAEQSFEIWQSVVVTTSGYNQGITARSQWNTKERVAAKQAALSDYLAKVVPTMKISREVAHIPREHPVSPESGDSD